MGVKAFRTNFPKTIYHVAAHSLDSWKILLIAQDLARFVDALNGTFSRFDAKLLAFAAVANHYHLAIETGLVPLSIIMHHLNTTIACAFNRRIDRHGAILRGRYLDIIVDSERYLLALIRYIHLNVVRAGLIDGVEALRRHPWTSHSTYMGFHNTPAVSPAAILERFGNSREALHQFVVDGAHEETDFDRETEALLERPEDGTARVIGSPDFVEATRARIVAATPRLSLPPCPAFDGLVLVIANWMEVPITDLFDGTRRHQVSAARSLIVHEAATGLRMTFLELSHRLGISESGVALAFKRGAELAKHRKVPRHDLGLPLI